MSKKSCLDVKQNRIVCAVRVAQHGSMPNRRRDIIFRAAALVAAPMVGLPVRAVPVGDPVDVHPVLVAAGLRHPWSLAFLPEGGFLVTEKDGGLVHITADGAQHPVRGLPDDLDNRRLDDPRDNSGLFDVVLDPDFADSRQLFISYASAGAGGTTTRLIRARLLGDRLHDVEVLFDALPRTSDRFHYGGGLLLDGEFLYLSVGERHFDERDNPPLPVAQDPLDRRGKVYRFTRRGELAPPPESAPHGWYACGVRSPQGLAVDPASGRIWFSDHGPVGGDELNVLRPGANYGWPVRTAGRYRNADYMPVRTLPDARYAAPAHVWTDQTIAPAGLCFYAGHAFPAWRGNLLVAGLGRGHLLRLVVQGERVQHSQALMQAHRVRLRNVKVSPAGDLFVVTDESNGRLIRLDRR
jgi:glucose/arabinose dehydrogenase